MKKYAFLLVTLLTLSAYLPLSAQTQVSQIDQIMTA